MKFDTPLELIGNTPVLNISSFFSSALKHKISIWMKLERFNLGGSIKDRVALKMIEEAERRGELNADTHIIEPTSGNTGIGLAIIAAIKKYKLTIVMPESMSIERRQLITRYGAQLILTPKEQGMQGAINRANELLAQYPNSWMPNQFSNPDNPHAHVSTLQEILNDFPQGVDYLIGGVGTGGHLSYIGKNLKKKFKTQILAVEPSESAVLSNQSPGPHMIQGIGAGFIPKNLERAIIDRIIQVKSERAIEQMLLFTAQVGISIGISTGANLQAVKQILPDLSPNSNLLLFNYDTGERYLS